MSFGFIVTLRSSVPGFAESRQAYILLRKPVIGFGFRAMPGPFVVTAADLSERAGPKE